MVAFAECFAPEKPAAEPETRVWDFFGDAPDRVGETASQVADRDWETTFVVYDSRRAPSLARSGQGEIYTHNVKASLGIFRHNSARFYPDDPAAIEAHLSAKGLDPTLPSDNRGKYITFSGGPDGKWKGRDSPLGNLRGDINRSTDLHDTGHNNVLAGTISLPAGVSTDQFVIQMVDATTNYNANRLDYDFFPGIQDGYNSHSYFRGLIESGGGQLNGNLGWRNPGINKPVPADLFGGP